jgi:hypothetical protein
MSKVPASAFDPKRASPGACNSKNRRGLDSVLVSDYIPIYLSRTEGVLMRRQEGGGGAAPARGDKRDPRTREALASRPPALRPAAP